MALRGREWSGRKFPVRLLNRPGCKPGQTNKRNMGRLLMTENGVQYLRNFKHYVVVWPDGRMSGPFEFPGVILLTTGDGPERTLKFVYPAHGVTKRRIRERLLDAGIAVLAFWVLRAVLIAL